MGRESQLARDTIVQWWGHARAQGRTIDPKKPAVFANEERAPDEEVRIVGRGCGSLISLPFLIAGPQASSSQVRSG